MRTLGEDGKKPRDKGWNRHRPSVDAVVDHLSDEGRLGIIPGSLDATVIAVNTVAKRAGVH